MVIIRGNIREELCVLLGKRRLEFLDRRRRIEIPDTVWIWCFGRILGG